MSQKMGKAALREYYLLKRNEIDDITLTRLNEAIKSQFLLFFKELQVKVVHTFLPIAHKKEIDTRAIIEALKLKSPDLKVVVSKSNMKTREMVSYLLEDTTKLEVNKWGIPEPINGKLIDDLHIDLILVPLLAFDTSGHRVGYGMGFYDRFVKKCRKDIVKVGLSLEPPVAAIPDAHAFDVTLDYCVTPERVYVFQDSTDV